MSKFYVVPEKLTKEALALESAAGELKTLSSSIDSIRSSISLSGGSAQTIKESLGSIIEQMNANHKSTTAMQKALGNIAFNYSGTEERIALTMG